MFRNALFSLKKLSNYLVLVVWARALPFRVLRFSITQFLNFPIAFFWLQLYEKYFISLRFLLPVCDRF